MDTLPFSTVSRALQDAFEALNTLAAAVPANDRPKFEGTVKRIAQAPIALDTWVGEQK